MSSVLNDVKGSTYPTTTTTKSKIFHPLRKYEFEWKKNPYAIILRIASKVKIATNTASASSCEIKRGSVGREFLRCAKITH